VAETRSKVRLEWRCRKKSEMEDGGWAGRVYFTFSSDAPCSGPSASPHRQLTGEVAADY
jgi:hypothetical protein